MQIIAHRKNTISELLDTPPKYGIEVDIRSFGEQLTIHHDPFVQGEFFEEWLRHYQHGTLVLNVKEEGLEARLVELMKENEITDYFFLDQSFPFLVKWAKSGLHNCAVRVSEFESITTAISLVGMIDWTWIDCFSSFPLTQVDYVKLKQAGFKLCIVSPELQGRDAGAEIPQLRKFLKEEGIDVDAVCTKRPDLWEI